jgi:hypothetical protein
METKNFVIILLSVILVFAIISLIGSVITGYVIHGNFDEVLSEENLSILAPTTIFSVVILVSIFVLRKKRIQPPGS